MTPRKKPTLDQDDALDAYVQKHAKLETVASTKAPTAKAPAKPQMVAISTRIPRELATAIEHRRRELQDASGFRVTVQDIITNALREYLAQPRTGNGRNQQ